MQKKIHAQAAVELLSYAAFFLLAFVATAVVFLQLQGQELARAENAYAQEIAYQFADYIQVAFVAGPGFRQNVTMPERLLDKPYEIAVSHGAAPGTNETGFVYVNWEGPVRNSTFSAPTITSNYNATTYGSLITVNGDFYVINPGTSDGSVVQIENIGGAIRFSRPS